MSPVITLTTDFGVSDHYVGTMKGVVASRSPGATVIDITHGVAPFSIWEGAYTIAQAAPYFPHGTIHVVVVDPGVGTDRRALLAEANGQLFIAPDNGVLSFVLEEGATVRELTNRDLFLDRQSMTFHGRDVFVAVAAAVAAGTAVNEVGPVLQDPVRLDPSPGRVLSVDHFGNVITNLPARLLPQLVAVEGVASRFRTFAEAPQGELFLYAGSSGYVEIGINQGRAADRIQLRPGDRIAFAPCRDPGQVVPPA